MKKESRQMFDVGPHFCSMKITQDVREYAAQKEIDEQTALNVGMKEKASLWRQVARFTRHQELTGLVAFSTRQKIIVSQGTLWELGLARQKLMPERLIISVADSSYLDFEPYAEVILGCEMPIHLGESSYIGFRPNWRPFIEQHRRWVSEWLPSLSCEDARERGFAKSFARRLSGRRYE